MSADPQDLSAIQLRVAMILDVLDGLLQSGVLTVLLRGKEEGLQARTLRRELATMRKLVVSLRSK